MEEASRSRAEAVPERFEPEAANPSLMKAEHWARYRLAADLAAGKRVLDAGCGTGYGTALLHEAGAAEVTGVDISAGATDAARARCPQAAILEASLLATGLPGKSFDLITCFEVIEHIAEQEQLLDELERLLAPEGILLISSPNRDVYLAGNPHHVRELTPAELDEMVSRRFANVSALRQHPWLASAILRQEAFEGQDPTLATRTSLIKASGASAGSETYTIAMASNVELPEAGQVTALCEPEDLRDYSRAIKALELRVEAAEASAIESDDLRAEAERETEWVRADLAKERENLARANAAIEQITGSLSWRITSPLRRLKNRP